MKKKPEPGDSDLTVPLAEAGRADEGSRIQVLAQGATTIPDPTLVVDPDPTIVLDGGTTTIPDTGTADPAPSSGGRPTSLLFANRFEVVSELGSGGMGRVYHVRDRQIDGRHVALKVLHPRFSRNERFRSLFFQEIHAAQKFVSEYVVQVRDTGQMEDGTLFLTMDLVEGQSLTALLEREESLRPRHALEIARQVLLGLQSGHEQGFIHRDVKPSNVMLAARVPKTDENPYGVAVHLLDFGIAGLAADVEGGAGTLKYMSPEQALKERLDARSDIFAVGILLYEMLAGSRPFEGDTVEEITSAVIETDVGIKIAQIEELTPPMRRILSKALCKEREKRFQSADEFVRAIERSKAFRLPREMPAWVLGAVGLLLIAVLVEGLLWNNASEESGRFQRESDDKDGRLADKDNSLHSQQEQIDRLQSENTTLRATISKGDVTEVRKEAFETRIADLEKESARTKNDLDALNSDLRMERERASKLEKELERERHENKADARTASGFDDILDLVGKGLGAGARDKLGSLEKDSIFVRGSSDGRDFVVPLVECAAAIQGGAANATAFHHASEQHALASEALASLPILGKDWINYERPDKPEPRRLEDARRAVDELGKKIEVIRAGRGGLDSQDWDAIAALPAAQDPSRAFQHADNFGCSHLAEYVKRCAAELEKQAVTGEALNTQALASLTCLEPWGKRLESRRPAPLGADEQTLLLLAFARRWYDEQPDHEDFIWNGIDVPPVTARTSSWRAVLKLESQLARSDSAFPLRDKRQAIYCDFAASKPNWRVERSDHADPTSSGTFEITRSHYDADGVEIGKTQRLLVNLPGSAQKKLRVNDWNDPILDLAANGESVWVEPFPTLRLLELPRNFSPSSDALESFRQSLKDDPEPCLVYRVGTATRWFSSKFGLIRESFDDGKISFELVFATPRY